MRQTGGLLHEVIVGQLKLLQQVPHVSEIDATQAVGGRRGGVDH